MLPAMPASLRAEHEGLRADLQRAMGMEGRIGKAARALASLLDLHFGKEDDKVLLALGLLQVVAQGQVAPAMREVVVMTDRLKVELPEMLAEHDQIRDALKRLAQTAVEEGRPKVAEFSEKLLQHARLEEEVLYPAAIILGEYLKYRLTTEGTAPQGGQA